MKQLLHSAFVSSAVAYVYASSMKSFKSIPSGTYGLTENWGIRLFQCSTLSRDVEDAESLELSYFSLKKASIGLR